MYMLNTNICIYINKEHPPQVLEKFRSIPLNQICMSSVTYAELFHGAMKSEQVAKNLEKITKLKTMISILPFDELAEQQ